MPIDEKDAKPGVMSVAFRELEADVLYEAAIIEENAVLLVVPIAGKLDVDRKLRISKLLLALLTELAPPGSIEMNPENVVYEEELPEAERGGNPTHASLQAALRARA